MVGLVRGADGLLVTNEFVYLNLLISLYSLVFVNMMSSIYFGKNSDLVLKNGVAFTTRSSVEVCL